MSDFSVVQSLSVEQRNRYADVSDTVRNLCERVDRANTLFEMMRLNYANCIFRTPMLKATWLCTQATTTFMKLETEQITGSFKARGALYFSKMANETGVDRIVTASTGNHAMGIVHALSFVNCSGTLYLPENSSPSKIQSLQNAIQGTSVNLNFKGNDCVEAELAAFHSCQKKPSLNGEHETNEEKVVYASPYNDLNVMAGNGTVGVEILDDLKNLVPEENMPGIKCACYITVGGGGLISGVAAKLKTTQPGKWRIVGCLPQNSAAMYESVKRGTVTDVENKATLSDGSAGGLQPGTITLGLCGHLVDAWAIVSEREIGNAMARVFSEQRKVLEGAAGVAVAGFLRDTSWRKQNDCSIAVIVGCGTNVEVQVFEQIISGRYKYDGASKDREKELN